MSERVSFWKNCLIFGILITSCGTSPSISTMTPTISPQKTSTYDPRQSPTPTETIFFVTETTASTPQPVLQLTFMLQEPNNKIGIYAVTFNCPNENPPCVSEPVLLFTFNSINDPLFTRHCWSGNGSHVLYSIDAVGWGDDIYRSDAAGNLIQSLTEEREFEAEHYPSWFGAGDEIVYFTCGTENEREYCALMKMNSDGSDPTRLIKDESMKWQFDPSPSLDGSIVVFSGVMAPDSRHQLFFVDSEGNQVKQITSGIGNKVMPALSPDNKQIVFVQYRSDWEGVGDLMIINADGTGSRVVASEWLTDFSGPTWSPIGNWIAYNKMFDINGWDVYISKSDGTGEIQITDSADTYKGLPSWRYTQ